MQLGWNILAVLAVCFGLGAFLGAPYVPILRRDLDGVLELADLQPGQTLIDLGSGDGRLLREAARRGARAIGYEINPLLVVWSRLATWRYRRLVRVHWGNMWQAELPPADVIYTFLLERYMQRLDHKLASELTRPTRVISYAFQLPRKPLRQTKNTFVYRYP